MGDGVVNPVSLPIPLSSSCHQLPSWKDGHNNNPETLKQSFSEMLTAAGLKSGGETYISFLLVNVQLCIFTFSLFNGSLAQYNEYCWLLDPWVRENQNTYCRISYCCQEKKLFLATFLQWNYFLCYTIAPWKLKAVFPTFSLAAIWTKVTTQHLILPT